MYRHSDRFPFLSGAYYLAHYVPRSQGGNDELSSYLLQFKDNNHTAVKKWSDFAAASLRSSGVNFKVIVRALGSSETTVHSGTPLDHLGQTIAGELGAVYMPKLLSKSRQNKSLKYLSAVERAQELTGLYSFNNYGAVSGDNLLLIDDVVTTGTTLKSIYKAIAKSCPNVNVYFFSLAKTFDSWRDVNNNTEIYSQMHSLNNNQTSQNNSVPIPYEESEPDWELMESIFQATSEEDDIIDPVPPGPNLIFTGDGWQPADGYKWVNQHSNNDYTVKRKKSIPPGPNLVETEPKTWNPADGYVWEDADDPKNFKVRKKERALTPTTTSKSPYGEGWSGRHALAGFFLGMSNIKQGKGNRQILRVIIEKASRWTPEKGEDEAERAVWEVYNWYVKLQTSNEERMQMFLVQIDNVFEIFSDSAKVLQTVFDDLIDIAKFKGKISDSDKSILQRVADDWKVESKL